MLVCEDVIRTIAHYHFFHAKFRDLSPFGSWSPSFYNCTHKHQLLCFPWMLSEDTLKSGTVNWGSCGVLYANRCRH